MKKTIVIEAKRCLGCKSCELACAVAHSKTKNLEEAINESPQPEHRIFIEQLTETTSDLNLPLTVPLQCRHCEDAPCVKVCPTKALTKSEDMGITLVRNELCIGCKWCILVCPFGLIKLNREGNAIIKCDLCIERLKEGKEPACVSSCPTKALKFKSLEEVIAKKRKDELRKYLVELEI